MSGWSAPASCQIRQALGQCRFGGYRTPQSSRAWVRPPPNARRAHGGTGRVGAVEIIRTDLARIGALEICGHQGSSNLATHGYWTPMHRHLTLHRVALLAVVVLLGSPATPTVAATATSTFTVGATV